MIRSFNKIKESITISDAYTLAMLIIYMLFTVFFWNHLDSPVFMLSSYLLVSAAVIGFALISRVYKGGNIFKLIRRLYIVPVVYFIYSQIHTFIPVINPQDYDQVLIEWDRFLFGGDPTHWFSQFSNPLLTEYLQLAYMTFYFIPLIMGIEFSLREKDDKFFSYARIIMFGFYLSYLLYLFMPAIGPRFHLHEFAAINHELPGLWLTEFFREAVNIGGGVSPDMANPMEQVNRDCMPSGHTMMTVINIAVAFVFSSRFKWLVFVLGISIIIATVYLRYHYVVDLIAGVLFAYLTIWIEPRIEKWLRNKGLYLYK